MEETKNGEVGGEGNRKGQEVIKSKNSLTLCWIWYQKKVTGRFVFMVRCHLLRGESVKQNCYQWKYKWKRIFRTQH